jgi:hypothetical protein
MAIGKMKVRSHMKLLVYASGPLAFWLAIHSGRLVAGAR